MWVDFLINVYIKLFILTIVVEFISFIFEVRWLSEMCGDCNNVYEIQDINIKYYDAKKIGYEKIGFWTKFIPFFNLVVALHDLNEYYINYDKFYNRYEELVNRK